MDNTMIAGTRELALSGSLLAHLAGVRLRAEEGEPTTGHGWAHGCPTTHLAGVCGPAAGAVLFFTSLIGMDAPVIDRMRMSAAVP